MLGRLHGRCKMMSRSYCECPDMYLVVLVGEGTIEQLVDSVVNGGGKCEPSGSGVQHEMKRV